MKIKTNLMLCLVLALGFTKPIAADESVIPPKDPTQSITYWKPHTLSPQQNPLAAKAQNIFSVLLRAWDSSRLEPSLYVVKSSSGPWAASLADGNILLSQAAIKTCLEFGNDRADHLLAFVLAHELAHQRADDLWHQRFFRLIGNQTPESRDKMLRGLQLDTKLVTNIEQKEAQADHDGLIMMSSVGFDPYQILDKKDFFTAWVENIWQNSCKVASGDKAEIEACRQAQARALRADAQLANVATQAMLYELGVQSFVAGRYAEARRYFTAYGRDYPSRAVMSSLGLTHLAEALQTQKQLRELGAVKQPNFYYPLVLDSSASATPLDSSSSNSLKRAANDYIAQQQLSQMRQQLEKAHSYFEKAMRLEPNHRKTYLLMAMAYLIDNNTFMARGVIQGKYLPRFGKDNAGALLLAMTSAVEGNNKIAQRDFQSLLKADTATNNVDFPSDLLRYTAIHNFAATLEHNGETEKALSLWKNLATEAKKQGNGFMFRLAVAHLGSASPPSASISSALQINGMRLGDRINKTNNAKQSELWIEGEQHFVYRLANGSRFVVNKEKRILSAWQDSGSPQLVPGFVLGDTADRPLKSFGIPSRRMHMLSGEYLAYDDYGIAIHIDNNKVNGWFLYK